MLTEKLKLTEETFQFKLTAVVMPVQNLRTSLPSRYKDLTYLYKQYSMKLLEYFLGD